MTHDDAKKTVTDEAAKTGRWTSMAIHVGVQAGLSDEEMGDAFDAGLNVYRRENKLCLYCGRAPAPGASICLRCGVKFGSAIVMIVPSLTLGLAGSIPAGPLFC